MNSDKLAVLMVQPELRWQDPQENLLQLGGLVREALQSRNADLILLPETFTTGFLGDLASDPEPMDGPTVEWMKSMAAEFDAAIAGSVAIGDHGQRRNRFLFVTPDGEVEFYDKTHLFTYAGEHERYQAGDQRVIVTFRGWRIALNVCYDLRFPVWCRNRNDYDLAVFVANWPSARAPAWKALLPARAIENQSCVIGINRVGRDGNGLEYLGQSAAYDGLGKELLNLENKVAAEVIELDPYSLRKLREELPFLADADSFHLG